jgi:hypothetical protein
MKPRKRVIYESGSDVAPGYRADGEGEYTRRAARGEVERASVAVDTVADLQRRLHRARVRASHHAERKIRQRAGEDARELEFALRRLGCEV